MTSAMPAEASAWKRHHMMDGWKFYKVTTSVHNCPSTRQGLSVVNVLSVRLRCGQSITWVQLTLEERGMRIIENVLAERYGLKLKK